MKKIFLLFATAFALTACDPVQEDVSNAGNITLEELRAKTVATTDKASDGKNGNVILCETLAPVNAQWTINGKKFNSNFAKRKMKVDVENGGSEFPVSILAICADGTILKDTFSVKCETITDELIKKVLYDGEPFTPGGWDAGPLRFSDTEGKHFPTLTDDVYNGLTTIIFDIVEASADATIRVMNGWWSATYYDGIVPKTGELLEVPITEQIAKECAKGGEGRDLNLLVTSGSVTFGEVYYEE